MRSGAPENLNGPPSEVDQGLSTHPHYIKRIIFNVYLQEDFDEYRQTFLGFQYQ